MLSTVYENTLKTCFMIQDDSLNDANFFIKEVGTGVSITQPYFKLNILIK